MGNRSLSPCRLSEKHSKASPRRTMLTHRLLSLSIQIAQGVNSLVLMSCVCAEGKGGPTRGRRSWGARGGGSWTLVGREGGSSTGEAAWGTSYGGEVGGGSPPQMVGDREGGRPCWDSAGAACSPPVFPKSPNCPCKSEGKGEETARPQDCTHPCIAQQGLQLAPGPPFLEGIRWRLSLV